MPETVRGHAVHEYPWGGARSIFFSNSSFFYSKKAKEETIELGALVLQDEEQQIPSSYLRKSDLIGFHKPKENNGKCYSNK